MAEDSMPVGERLGSERLYDEHTLPPVGRGALFVVESPEVVDPPKVAEKPKQPPKQPPAPKRKRPPRRKWADLNWRGFASTCLELAGIVAITVGCALIAAWLAFIVCGILLTVLGVATGLEVTK